MKKKYKQIILYGIASVGLYGVAYYLYKHRTKTAGTMGLGSGAIYYPQGDYALNLRQFQQIQPYLRPYGRTASVTRYSGAGVY